MKLTEEQRDDMLQKFDAYLEARQASNTKRKINEAKVRSWTINNPETKKIRENAKRKFGFDPVTDKEKFPVMKESFSWDKFKEQLQEKMALREADASSAFPVFLIAGVLQNAIGMYEQVKMTYEDWATVVPVKLPENPIALLQGTSFPREVGPNMPYPEVGAQGLNLKLRVKKFGSVYPIEQELLDDDQTGQFQMMTGQIGEYLKMLTEVLVYGKLASASGMNYAGLTIPTSETKPSYETNYPWASSSGTLKGGGVNRPTSYGAFGQANIQTGIETLMQQTNVLGLQMNVNVNRILISPLFRFDAAILLNSAYYPSGAQSAGVTGGAFSINPLQGIADLSVTRFMPNNSGAFAVNSKAWYLVDDSKPWFQIHMRTPISVEQENPLSGDSFNRDVYRFKCRTRINADHVDPRFAWQGNDGSV